ncbi:MAG: inorganic phosphate transporter [Melioribacteraceae bacterium]|nr:inorganic phosphate transporter [Melioribacteraceae bacterium]
MELFLIVVVILFILAISDLIVGVSNDAVNFLNSAIGSRVAPRHIIMLVASLGVLAGTLFSSGMMEVARKGIFNPEQFYFAEIMIIFLAVMLTDVILLDFFNTLGLPTSTTVSIVFELLGAAVAVSLIKIGQAGDGIDRLIEYINTSKAIAIISGILLSIVVAFSVGAIIQFFTRIIFTFDYVDKLKKYGGIFGGVALTAITFFILIKGAKGATFMSAEFTDYIGANVYPILLYSLIAWTIVFQLLIFLKINIFKIIVLIGTFALALAFAANDLVNFIGVPLAGLNSYQLMVNSSDPFNTLMEVLREKTHSNTWFLAGAGLVMVGTLYFNKKARSVIKTSLDLGRQQEGVERFESSLLARTLVRMNVNLGGTIKRVFPNFLLDKLNNRFKNFDRTPVDEEKNPISFDLIRASVNLLVASILISFATSWKLPLSTTYVTFMVAMGTSFSDKAWGRESAVYRVNGVLTVIGGWFMTAISAFTVSAVFAVILFYLEGFAMILLSVLAMYIIYRTHVIHKNREIENAESESVTIGNGTSKKDAIDSLADSMKKSIEQVAPIVLDLFKGLSKGDRSILQKAKKSSKKLDKKSRKLISDLFNTVQLIEEDVKESYRYGKVINSLQEITANLRSLAETCIVHVENNHNNPSSEQTKELMELYKNLEAQLELAAEMFGKGNYSDFKKLSDSREEFAKMLNKLDKDQISRVKKKTDSTRNSLLQLSIYSDSDNISNHNLELVKAWQATIK